MVVWPVFLSRSFELFCYYSLKKLQVERVTAVLTGMCVSVSGSQLQMRLPGKERWVFR